MTTSLPKDLYSCEQSRAIDREAVARGTEGILLMKRAGRAAFDLAQSRWPGRTRWLVLCGGGNNAGDGYVFAALAAQRRHLVQVLWLRDPQALSGEALAAFRYAEQERVAMAPFQATLAEHFISEGDGVVIDALLGTGLKGEIRSPYASVIAWLNDTRAQRALPVLALDVPSGVDADTGSDLGAAVEADVTLTFIVLKAGLLTGRAPGLTGCLYCDDLGLPSETSNAQRAIAQRIDLASMGPWIPKRNADAHKGQYGHVMVVGGNRGMGGAAIMAAETAAMCGAGLVSLATDPSHVVASLVRRPEVMVIGVPSGQELEPHLARPSVLVVGPGLGQEPWSEQLLQQVLKAELPMVLDADALNLLAKGRLNLPANGTWVMTPHPGEAARLLDCSVKEVQANRFEAARKLQSRYGGVVVLKGAGTILCDGAELYVAQIANAGLATGGTGDVLSGLIGSLMAQGLPAIEAAKLAVCLHGEAAKHAVETTGMAGMVASELPLYLRKLLP